MPKISKLQARQLKIPKSSIQSILINNKIPIQRAKDWLYEHKFYNNTIRKQKNYNRFRQEHDIEGATFAEKHFTPEIIFVYQYY